MKHALETYNIPRWSEGYVDVDEAGELRIRPRREGEGWSLSTLVARAREQGLTLPLLLRFCDILGDRIDTLCDAFAQAARTQDYGGGYTAIYPIKVNQQRSVVEEIVRQGGERVGLEAGSKPELLAVLAMSRPGGTIICNGYKDREYVRLALIGQQLGQRVFIVIEKPSELGLVLEESARLGVQPQLGVRVRLVSIAAGNWQNTGGEKSKFGLSAEQTLAMVEQLRSAGSLDALRLLHFHMGSQVANIRDVQRALREAARFYAELRRLQAPVDYVDVGGGLGVDYDGTRSRDACSMNYSVQEYANNIVHALWTLCEREQLPHPAIMTESGRALTAHHAVLVTSVIAVEQLRVADDIQPPAESAPLLLHSLWNNLQNPGQRSPLEMYHDAVHWLGEICDMYTLGVVTLEQRARAEQLYTATCHIVRPRLQAATRAHRQLLDELNEKLADKYFCNFSLFQSLPDVWAIDQIFPIVPLARLDEMPDRRAVIHDVTCDSDGRIDYYVDREGVESTLPLHALRPGEEYLLGIFLTGAYQEILGDMHNLFGDTDAVNVRVVDGGCELEQPQRGDTVDAVLRYVHIDSAELLLQLQHKVDAAALPADVQAAALAALQAGLHGITYLED